MSVINNLQVTIETVVPTIKLGEIIISADRRSTKEKPLTDAERIRRAILPVSFWGNYAATLEDVRSQELTDILREKLKELAGARLRDSLETNPEQRLIELADYTIPALLAWSQETASSRGSISFTRDEVTAWFATSATRQQLATKHASNPKLAAVLALVEKRFGTLAAKNHGLATEEEALKLATMIATEDTTGKDAALVAGISARLEHISKALAAKANEATVSMDDI